MNKYKGYLIDLDGTMYRGTERIDAGQRLVERLNAAGIPYIFVTNNSSRRPDQVAEKLRDMGINALEENVMTTSMATAKYIKKTYGDAAVYVIGEEGLREAVEAEGLSLSEEEADVVVMGIDRKITYEKLAKACLFVRSGAAFLSTNGDKAIPTERGMLPGNGSLTAVVQVSTGQDPLFIGKPEAVIMEQALQALGTDKKETLMIGDNYDTDILAGIRAGLDTLMVFTGVSTREELAEKGNQPVWKADSLDEWSVEKGEVQRD
ncbi:TIGR01457 family HAD-type hydrolase [Alkalicoccus saliphilus]|jgi:4-nitrophenyl phosphatase|uniref:Acid sugar phosphatase n=1 Tax=Alkalicoccus saliphilus TaxID=200989 RepID=A0A2T4U692_9BACI|nr:TIGR01457 family HAD-type hydrolase [Alkalicoccus saliphilus]PTL38917.1 TIGR01457 family HAD-type hydrolase [Alkalicoccus saliphilus]